MTFKKGLALVAAVSLLLPYAPTKVDAATTSTSASNDNNRWELVWSDEFNGTSLDLTKWAYETGSAYNNEAQYYTKNNVSVSNGTLKITAKKENKNGYEYTSGRIETITEAGEALFSTKYGKIEARIKLPAGTGLWPAFWMQPVERKYGTWPLSGEIDIMEARGRILNEANAALHYGELAPLNQHVGGKYTFPSGTDITDYHIYAVEWREKEIIWSIDGVEYFSTSDWYTKKDGVVAEYPAPFNQEFYLILNLAVGGDYDNLKLPADSEIPATMEVDYVRVYRDVNGYKDSATTTPTLVESPNLLTNSNFENINTTMEYIQDIDLTNGSWHFTTNKDILGVATISKKVINGSTYANINIKDGGKQVYAVQLLHEIPLTKGTTYTVRFDAMSPDGDRTIKVKAYGDTNYSSSYVANITTQMQTFEFTFTMNKETDLNAMIQMNLGANNNDLIIGNVSATYMTYATTEEPTIKDEVVEPEKPSADEDVTEPDVPSVDEDITEPDTPSVDEDTTTPEKPSTGNNNVTGSNFLNNFWNTIKNWWKK